jgi:hypothetical protein
MSSDTGQIGGFDFTVNKPSTYDSGGPWSVIIHHRGVGETHDLVVNDPKNGVTAAVSEAYLYASIDTEPDVNFGNDDSLTRYTALLDYLIANYNTTGLAGIIAQSAGGPSGIRHYLADSRVKALYGIFPITNTAWADANGFSVPGDAFDPNLEDTAEYTGKNFHFIHSDDDLIVPPTNNTHLFRTKIGGVAARSGLTASTGDHGDDSSFVPSEILTFFGETVVPDAATPVLYLFRS